VRASFSLLRLSRCCSKLLPPTNCGLLLSASSALPPPIFPNFRGFFTPSSFLLFLCCGLVASSQTFSIPQIFSDGRPSFAPFSSTPLPFSAIVPPWAALHRSPVLSPLEWLFSPPLARLPLYMDPLLFCLWKAFRPFSIFLQCFLSFFSITRLTVFFFECGYSLFLWLFLCCLLFSLVRVGTGFFRVIGVVSFLFCSSRGSFPPCRRVLGYEHNFLEPVSIPPPHCASPHPWVFRGRGVLPKKRSLKDPLLPLRPGTPPPSLWRLATLL